MDIADGLGLLPASRRRLGVVRWLRQAAAGLRGVGRLMRVRIGIGEGRLLIRQLRRRWSWLEGLGLGIGVRLSLSVRRVRARIGVR